MRRIHSSIVATAIAASAVAMTMAEPPRAQAARNNGTLNEGRSIFRYETFGDEQLWTDVLRMHEVVATLSPKAALGLGLKVDAEALPQSVIDALKAGDVDLDDPAVTLLLLQLNAVVGVRGEVEGGHLTRVGITCALCHSTVDNSFAEGIGPRLDGWANTDLNVGAIVAASPFFADNEELKAEFNAWGPGMYDPRHHAFNGVELLSLHTPSSPIVIPPIYGLKGVRFETVTADGPISYWNSYVGVGQMGGQGNFNDPRIDLFINQTPDLVTPKLPALLAYQLSLETPAPPENSLDKMAAHRGKQLFNGKAECGTCHRPPHLTDVLSGPRSSEPFVHDPDDTKMDATYASRSATKGYRTTPLRALWQHAPYFHDGSAPTLLAVIQHYEQALGLDLTPDEEADLVAYLKSL